MKARPKQECMGKTIRDKTATRTWLILSDVRGDGDKTLIVEQILEQLLNLFYRKSTTCNIIIVTYAI